MPKTTVRSLGAGRALVYLDGENIGSVHSEYVPGAETRWYSSLTGRVGYATRKLAVKATVNKLTQGG